MKNKSIVFLAGFILLSCIFSPMQAQTHRTLIYMLCDFTGSIDSAKKSIVNNIRSICRQIPETDETDIKLFRVSKENAPNMIHSLSLHSVTGKKKTDIMMSRVERLESILDFGSFVEKGFGRYPTDGSCLIKSLEVAGENLKASKGYNRIYLLVFSDMMEACKYNGQKFDFQNSGTTQAIKWLKTYSPIEPLFGGIPDFSMAIFASSVGESSNTGWKTFWKEWIRKNGYIKPVEISSVVSENWFSK